MYRFTDRARGAIAEANRQAIRLLGTGDPRQRAPRWWTIRLTLPQEFAPPELSPVHMLLGIACGPRGIGYHAIAQCGVNPEQLSHDIISRLPRLKPVSLEGQTVLPLSWDSGRVVRAAVEEAYRLSHSWVGTEHLLLALCGANKGLVSRTLKRHQIHADRVRTFVVANMHAQTPPEPS